MRFGARRLLSFLRPCRTAAAKRNGFGRISDSLQGSGAAAAVSSNRMEDETKAAYPFSRAFVIQFRGDSGPGTRRFVGRVEHLRSGRRAHFGTRKELFAFVESVLVRADGGSPEGESSSKDWS